jgi:hypothetical protein
MEIIRGKKYGTSYFLDPLVKWLLMRFRRSVLIHKPLFDILIEKKDNIGIQTIKNSVVTFHSNFLIIGFKPTWFLCILLELRYEGQVRVKFCKKERIIFLQFILAIWNFAPKTPWNSKLLGWLFLNIIHF